MWLWWSNNIFMIIHQELSPVLQERESVDGLFKMMLWCRGQGLNRRQLGLQPSALPGWATSASSLGVTKSRVKWEVLKFSEWFVNEFLLWVSRRERISLVDALLKLGSQKWIALAAIQKPKIATWLVKRYPIRALPKKQRQIKTQS